MTPAATSTTPGTPTTGPRSRTIGARRNQHSPGTPPTGLHERGNNTSSSTGRSSRQNAATRRSMRREQRVPVQGPVKKQQPDGMSHTGGWGGLQQWTWRGKGVFELAAKFPTENPGASANFPHTLTAPFPAVAQ